MISTLPVRRMDEPSSIPDSLEWLPDAVLILGGEGQILLVNAAAGDSGSRSLRPWRAACQGSSSSRGLIRCQEDPLSPQSPQRRSRP